MRIANMPSLMLIRQKDWLGRPQRPNSKLVPDGSNGRPRVFPTSNHVDQWIGRHTATHEGYEYLPRLVTRTITDRVLKPSFADWTEFLAEALGL